MQHPDIPLSHIKIIFKYMIKYCNLVSPHSQYRSRQSCSVIDIKNKINAFLYNLPEDYEELSLDKLIELIVGKEKYKKALRALENEIIATIRIVRPDISPDYIVKIFRYMINYCDLTHPEGGMHYSIFTPFLI
jgi:hypothetical protein